MNKKVSIVYFGSISNRVDKAHYWFGFDIVSFFLDEGDVQSVFCIESHGLADSDYRIHQFAGTIWSKVSYSISIILNYFGYSNSRKITETGFELFVLWNINFKSLDQIIFLRATSLKVILRAKKRKIKVFGLISIFPRDFIKQHLAVEERKWGVSERSDYTSLKRANLFNRILSEWDIIIPWSGTKANKSLFPREPFYQKLRFLNSDHGVNNDLFYFKPLQEREKIHFLVITDATLKKGLLNLLDAWQTIEKKYNGIQLTVAGNVGTHIQTVIDSRFSFSKVDFLGFVENIQDFFWNHDVFVCPSIIDMGPRTIKQAMACGRMVIASDHCGHSGNIEHGIDGLVYNASESESLLKCLESVIKHRSNISQMGLKASEKASVFSDRKYAEELFEISKTV